MRIAIIGTVPHSKIVAPYDDPTWDIWVCSPGNSQGGAPKRISTWFELHSLVDMHGEENQSWYPNYVKWLNENSDKFPIFMQEENADVPSAQRFPREPLIERWGKNATRTNWFTSSIAWMMAYALHLGAKEIGIFGVDMAATEEHYSWQKAGCLRFCEIARDMGVKITMPLESTLSVPFPLYGYAEQTVMGRSLIVREQELAGKVAAIAQTIQRLQMESAFFNGALEQVKFDRRTWVDGQDDAQIDPAAIKAEVDALAPELAKAAAEGSKTAIDSFVQGENGLFTPPKIAPNPNKIPTASDFADNPDAADLLPNGLPRQRRTKNGRFEKTAEG